MSRALQKALTSADRLSRILTTTNTPLVPPPQQRPRRRRQRYVSQPAEDEEQEDEDEEDEGEDSESSASDGEEQRQSFTEYVSSLRAQRNQPGEQQQQPQQQPPPQPQQQPPDDSIEHHRQRLQALRSRLREQESNTREHTAAMEDYLSGLQERFGDDQDIGWRLNLAQHDVENEEAPEPEDDGADAPVLERSAPPMTPDPVDMDEEELQRCIEEATKEMEALDRMLEDQERRSQEINAATRQLVSDSAAEEESKKQQKKSSKKKKKTQKRKKKKKQLLSPSSQPSPTSSAASSAPSSPRSLSFEVDPDPTFDVSDDFVEDNAFIPPVSDLGRLRDIELRLGAMLAAAEARKERRAQGDDGGDDGGVDEDAFSVLSQPTKQFPKARIPVSWRKKILIPQKRFAAASRSISRLSSMRNSPNSTLSPLNTDDGDAWDSGPLSPAASLWSEVPRSPSPAASPKSSTASPKAKTSEPLDATLAQAQHTLSSLDKALRKLSKGPQPTASNMKHKLASSSLKRLLAAVKQEANRLATVDEEREDDVRQNVDANSPASGPSLSRFAQLKQAWMAEEKAASDELEEQWRLIEKGKKQALRQSKVILERRVGTLKQLNPWRDEDKHKKRRKRKSKRKKKKKQDEEQQSASPAPSGSESPKADVLASQLEELGQEWTRLWDGLSAEQPEPAQDAQPAVDAVTAQQRAQERQQEWNARRLDFGDLDADVEYVSKRFLQRTQN